MRCVAWRCGVAMRLVPCRWALSLWALVDWALVAGLWSGPVGLSTLAAGLSPLDSRRWDSAAGLLSHEADRTGKSMRRAPGHKGFSRAGFVSELPFLMRCNAFFSRQKKMR